jgi:signal transduction histidine kinase
MFALQLALQVVRNFMSNAIKFTPTCGTVTISLKLSHMDNPGEIESQKHMTEEEVILFANSQNWDSNYAGTEKDGLKPVKGGESAEQGRGTNNTDAVENSTVVDGKRYKKYGTVIVSFVDTGAGISKVNIHYTCWHICHLLQ